MAKHNDNIEEKRTIPSVDHKKVVLNKSQVKERNEQKRDYSKQMDTRVHGGGRHGVYLGKGATDRKATIFRIWQYLGHYKTMFIVVFAANIIASLLGLLIPYIFAIALNDYIINFDFSGAYRMGAYIVIIALINSLVLFVGRYLTLIISQNTIAHIRKDAFDKLQLLPVKYYDQNQSGNIVSRLTNDVDLINNVLASFIIEALRSVVSLVGSLIFMFVINWIMAIIVIAFVPILMFFTKKVGTITRKGFVAQQKHLGNLNGIVEESISGLKVLKLYGMEKESYEEFVETNIKLRDAGYKAQVVAGFIMPFINFMNNLIYVVLIAVGAVFILTGIVPLSVGDLYAVTQYGRQFIQPISNLAQLFNTLQQGLAGAERVFNLIDEPTEYEENGVLKVTELKGNVSFNNVSFGYEKDKTVLQDITFEAEAGKTIAIVGPTGSGKTTIINLVNRFYDVDTGVIAVDGTDILEYDKDQYRKRIGVVLQDTSLFSGTVYDNIVYGNLEATKEEVIEAAKTANAHDFIMMLPHGYDSEVLEGGNNFSQGERQLISIARTILSNPDILILDEATSNVDTRTEFKIQDSMRKLMKGRTNVVIAHRLQTIRDADKILVIKDGRLIEQGSHHELLHEKGFYYDLYTTQFKDLVLQEDE
jgi:ATP-binding cassette subfamily B protein